MTADPVTTLRHGRPVGRRLLTDSVIMGLGALVFGFGARAVSGVDEVGWIVASVIILLAVTVPTRSGIPYSLSLAAVVAAPIVLLGPDDTLDPPTVLATIVFGSIGLHATMIAMGGSLRRHLLGTLRHLFVSIVGVGVFVLLADGLLSASDLNLTRMGSITIAITIAAAAWFFLDVVILAVEAAALDGKRLDTGLALGLREWPVAMSMMATGALFGLALEEISAWWWALGVTLIPYAMAHLAFLRAHETRRTYRQTIRALSRIPEVSAYSPDGHGDRTAALATTIGQELGMRPDDLEELEYAAQMHDIGRITLNQPSILRMGFTEEDIARWGSEMIGDVSYLGHVSELIRKQHEPYRRPGQERDLELPIGSKIIKAASAYDHATTELGFLPLEALEVLHRGAAYDYDPDVVSAIRTVLEREGAVPS